MAEFYWLNTINMVEVGGPFKSLEEAEASWKWALARIYENPRGRKVLNEAIVILQDVTPERKK